jgi:hypothetical protein
MLLYKIWIGLIIIIVVLVVYWSVMELRKARKP